METIRHLEWLNALDHEEATKELLKCCGSRRWAEQMSMDRPFGGIGEITTRANELWWSLGSGDWLEAFRSHPKIGERKAANVVSAQAQQWSNQEQSGARNAPSETIEELARLNREYEAKFGFIFIVCATGKTLEEILAVLHGRLGNEATKELSIAASEQARITDLRLRKLLIGS